MGDIPINDKDDPEKWDGGTHWSLIVYNRRDNVYLYFDPIKGMNENHARALHLTLIAICVRVPRLILNSLGELKIGI